MDRCSSAARAVGIVLAKRDEFLLEFSCESCPGEALLVEEMAQVCVGDVIGGVAVTVLSIAAGFDQIFDNFDRFFAGHALRSFNVAWESDEG